MSDVSRRRLLAASGTALAGAVAGCTGSDDDTEDEALEETGDTEPESSEIGSETTVVDRTILGDITIDNLDDAAHDVDVLVEFDREIEDWATEVPGADSGTTLERNWPGDPGEFRVTARRRSGRPRTDHAGELERTLSLLDDTSSGPCGDGDVDLGDADE